MTSADWFMLLAIFACLLLSVFLAASKTALNGLSHGGMQRLEHQGNRRAAIVNRLLASRERLMGALLLGNGVVTIAATVLATGVLLGRFGNAGLVCAVVIMTVLVVLAQVFPKAAAMRAPDRVALMIARPMELIVRALTPILLAIESLTRHVLSLGGVQADEKPVLSAHEWARGGLPLQRQNGDSRDHEMIGSMIDLGELEVSDVMIHRTKMLTLCIDDQPEEIVAALHRAPFTRWPLWSGSQENIVGILHAKDLLHVLYDAGGDASKLDIRAIMMPPWFVPDTTPLYEQIKAFRRRKTAMAMVVDEYGEVMGLVTIQDILDEVVGDIADERDIAVPGIRPQPDGSVNVDGGVPIRDLNRVMDWALPDEEATTLAGLVIHEARSIPETGQSFTFHSFRFQVLRRNRNRITALRITPLADKSSVNTAVGS
jgi:Mg2+/Co2+ transporter CorB